MRALDLFSGIGGFSLGLERAGMKTVAFCEIDPFCREVLRKHWPDVPIHEDITTLDGKQYAGTIDVICGGFPCQPFSVAGQRKGKEDNRHLWPEMLRVISEAKPTWVIGENVPGIISMELEQVCADLEGEGYEVQALVIPACAVNAPHRRSRLWIIAYSKHTGWDSSPQQGSNRETVCRKQEGADSAGEPERVGTSPFMANTYGAGREEFLYSGFSEKPEYSARGDVATGNYWATEPGICRVAYGVPHRVDRIKALGNAVVPQIIEVIGRAIMEVGK